MDKDSYHNTGLVQSIELSSEGTFSLPVCKLDELNINGRIYSAACFDGVAKDMPLFGWFCCDSNGYNEILEPMQCSHMLTSLDITKDGFVVGNFTILDTPIGDMLSELVKVKKVFPRMRGEGGIEWRENKVTNYTLMGVDFLILD